MNFLLSIDVYSYVMTTEDTEISKSSQKDKEESPTRLSAETGEDNTTKTSHEKKVTVVFALCCKVFSNRKNYLPLFFLSFGKGQNALKKFT